MTTTPEEQKDLADLSVKQDQIRSNAFSMFREILRMDEKQLRTIGCYTIEGALKTNVEAYLKQLDRNVAAHIKKWPDK